MSHTTEFDCVLAFSSSMARYALTVPARRHVLDLCDLDSRKWLDYANESRAPLKWLYAAEARRLAQKEIEWIHRFDASILITKAEARHLDGAVPPGKLHIVGNGVRLPDSIDATTVSRNISTATVRERPAGYRQSQGCQNTKLCDGDTSVVGFVGVMNYKPNVDAVVWFVRHCWPAIRSVHPRAVFRIIGRSPVKRIQRLARLPGVQVVGEVESVHHELRNVDVSVAPLRIARGLQNKVLEAMAAAKPVVLTSGAAQGIDANDGEHFLIADTPEATIRAVNRLLADPEERHALGHAARSYVANHHCWHGELTKFEQIATGVLSTRVGCVPDAPESPLSSKQVVLKTHPMKLESEV
ncbi:MAG: glycosyltransferase [Planctomycetes bacterium]|nr:glycosyltransferase [Planctomycetota bacterium]